MRLTIRDVSEAAGVSIKTVSRVLNKEKYVREETRRKVEAAVAALGFRPSSAARALAGRRSFQIALLYANASPYYVFHIQGGARERCQELGLRLIVQPCDIGSPKLAEDVRALIDETHVDGLILAPPVTDALAVLEELERRGLPYVRIAPTRDEGAASAVYMDDVAAAEEMTAHLIGLGHRRIGFITGDPDHGSTGVRLQGYRQALAAAGIAEDPSLIRPGRFDFESGREAATALLDGKAPPTAIFASNDDMAVGVLAVAHERGIAVPAQLSVAGFDDSDHAQFAWPPLTTIRQPIRDLAYVAADLLADEGGGVRRCALPYELVVRASTAAPGRLKHR